MASRRRGGRSSRASATLASSRSIAARQRPSVASVPSFTQIGDLERTVGALHEPLDPRLDLAKLLGRRAKTRDSLFEEGERAFQLDLLRFQLAHDLLEPAQSLFKAHVGSSTPVTRAPTAPSRSSTLNGMPSANCFADVSVRPSMARSTSSPPSTVP